MVKIFLILSKSTTICCKQSQQSSFSLLHHPWGFIFFWKIIPHITRVSEVFFVLLVLGVHHFFYLIPTFTMQKGMLSTPSCLTFFPNLCIDHKQNLPLVPLVKGLIPWLTFSFRSSFMHQLKLVGTGICFNLSDWHCAPLESISSLHMLNHCPEQNLYNISLPFFKACSVKH